LNWFFCNRNVMLFLQLFFCNHTAIRLQSRTCDKVAIMHILVFATAFFCNRSTSVVATRVENGRERAG
jgi:hypothetical protein